MCLQNKALPFNDVDGVKFNCLVRTELILKNGKKTVMFTVVPEAFSFDDVCAGINVGARYSGNVSLTKSDVYTLQNGEIIPFSKGYFYDPNKMD